MTRWLAYCLMTVCFAAAVLLKGGVYPHQWEWSALGISLAAAVFVLSRSEHEPSLGNSWGLILLPALFVWMVLQLVPLPPALLRLLSPLRWDAVAAAREATLQAKDSWAALSLAPGATLARLLDVIPAMAAFVAAREMGWQWRDRMWIAVAPVIGVASIESLLGLLQFRFLRMAAGAPGPVTGTYVNRNHFSGLLEMAFPLAVMAALAAWRKGAWRRQGSPVSPALATGALAGAAACLLMGIILSQSRAGFISTLMAVGFMMLMFGLSPGPTASRRIRRFRWGVLIAAPLLILVFLTTPQLILRFADADVSKDGRMEIWQNTLPLVSAYKWTGTGLGAYERGLYRYKTVAPAKTIDFAHNDYLQILAELGIVGAALAGALGLWIFLQPLRTVMRGRGSPNWPLAVGLLAALLTLGVHSLADFNLYIPANALAFAWLSGVAASFGLQRS